jgi:hypothetical protein
LSAHRRVCERIAALTGRHDVRTDMAERDQPTVALDGGEASEPTTRNVLEEDTLDRFLGAKCEDLIERWPGKPRDEARL